MKISIIVPIYNQQDYIVDTINSIKKQTFTDFECILINDGSTDESQKIIEHEIINDQRFNLINRKNEGVSAARNYGIEHSKGEYVYFIDGDDTIPEDALKILYTTAIEKDADIVIGKMVHKVNSINREISTYVLDGVYKSGYKSLEKNPEILHSIGPTAKLMKREIISHFRFPINIKFAEEHEFIVNAFANSKNIYTVEDLVYYYHIRKQNNSATQRIDENVKEYVLNLIHSHENVHMILVENNYYNALKFYGYRITNYIMLPLLIKASNTNQLNELTATIDHYLSSNVAHMSIDKKRIKEIYYLEVIRNINYQQYFKQKKYFVMIKRHYKRNSFNVPLPNALKFYTTKLYIKIYYFIKRMYRKIKMNM